MDEFLLVFLREKTFNSVDVSELVKSCFGDSFDVEITCWAQERFAKSLSLNAVHCAIHKCWLIMQRRSHM